MLYKTLSAAVYGIDASLIEVEVDIAAIKTDKDIFTTVGLPDATVREAASAFAQPSRTAATTFLLPTPPSIWLPPTSARRARASTCPWRWEFSAPMAG